MNRAFLCAGIVCAFVALAFLRPHGDSGPPMRDFEAYYAAGAAANAHADPYGAQLWRFEAPLDPHEHYALLPFVSPAWTLPFMRALARLPFAAANVLWRGVLLACIAALVLVTLRFAGTWPSPFTIACGACIAVGFAPLTSAFALGQLALVAFAGACAAYVWPPAAIAAWTQPNVAFTLFSRPPRAVLLWTLAGLLIVVIPLNTAYLLTLALHANAERESAIQFSVEAIALGFGATGSAAAALAATLTIAAFIVWLIAMKRLRDPLERFAVGCALLPFGMAFFHEHDFIVAIVPCVMAMLRCTARMLPVAATASLLCAVDWLGLAQRPDGIAQSAVLAAVFFMGAAALRRDVTPVRALGAALVPYAVFAGAAFGALHHPLAVWPNGMHPLAQTSFPSAANAWHAELAATGLFARDGVWSALRTLPLAGCALLTALFLRGGVHVHHVVERRNGGGMEIA